MGSCSPFSKTLSPNLEIIAAPDNPLCNWSHTFEALYYSPSPFWISPMIKRAEQSGGVIVNIGAFEWKLSVFHKCDYLSLGV